MRYSRITPNGEVFNFKTEAKNLPYNTTALSLGIRKGIIAPDLLFNTQKDEAEEDAFTRLRKDLLERLDKYQNAEAQLEKDFTSENVLRCNINWPATENLK